MKTFIYIGLTISLILQSCSQKMHTSSSGWDYTSKNQLNEEQYILKANYDFVVKNIDSCISQLYKILDKNKGKIIEGNLHQTVLQVPSENFSSFLKEIEILGEISSKKISASNVTEKVQNLEVKLENAIKSRDRYLELLEKSSSMDNILKVERELERLSLHIDQLETEKFALDKQVAYSTIIVSYKNKVKPGILGYLGIGIYKSIKWLFVR